MPGSLTRDDIDSIWVEVVGMTVHEARAYLSTHDIKLRVNASEDFAIFHDGVPDYRRINVATREDRVVAFMGIG